MELDVATPDEVAAIIAAHSHRDPYRIRATETLVLNSNGGGVFPIYKVPAGYDFVVRRVNFNLSTAADPATGNIPLASQTSQVDVDNSASGAASAIVATLPAAVGATTYLTGFEVTGAGATAGSVVTVTVTGIAGGTKTYDVVIPAGVGTSITPLTVEFTRPIPASGVNQAIAVNVPSFGAGNTNAAVTAHGFQQTTTSGTGKYIQYLRSDTLIAYAEPKYNGLVQVPGGETWGDEQGPYIRNAETFSVNIAGLTPNASLTVFIQGLLSEPGGGEK